MCLPSTSRPSKTCSSTVKTELVQIAFVAISLVLLAALQDMLPSFGGAKIPLLQVFALYVALTEPSRASERRSRTSRSVRWVWTAGAVGYLMEALSGFPLGSCICFLVPACAFAHMLRRMADPDLSTVALGIVAALAYAPLQEAWLASWGGAGGDSAVVRFFASIAFSVLAGAVLFAILPKVERFAGLCEEEIA